MNTRKIAYLNILVALVFALIIIFFDLDETSKNWMIVLWLVISSSLSVIATKRQK